MEDPIRFFNLYKTFWRSCIISKDFYHLEVLLFLKTSCGASIKGKPLKASFKRLTKEFIFREDLLNISYEEKFLKVYYLWNNFLIHSIFFPREMSQRIYNGDSKIFFRHWEFFLQVHSHGSHAKINLFECKYFWLKWMCETIWLIIHSALYLWFGYI